MKARAAQTRPILSLDEISIGFPIRSEEWTTVVDRVSIVIRERERVGLVGQSGSGKSLTALAAIGLVPEPGAMTGGTAMVDGIDLKTATPHELERIRGGEVGLILQEAATALNPVFSVGFQLSETVRCQRGMRRRLARTEALRLMGEAGIEDPATLYPAYPHQLSGGQAQRVMVALALAGRPRLLVADEPTSALDVTAQARVLASLRRVCETQGLALLLISHDLAVVAGAVDHVLVMLAGEIIEEAPTEALFTRPLHPYTELLLTASRTRMATGRKACGLFQEEDPAGCRFSPMCPVAEPPCLEQRPELETLPGTRRLRCPVRRPQSGES